MIEIYDINMHLINRKIKIDVTINRRKKMGKHNHTKKEKSWKLNSNLCLLIS